MLIPLCLRHVLVIFFILRFLSLQPEQGQRADAVFIAVLVCAYSLVIISGVSALKKPSASEGSSIFPSRTRTTMPLSP